MAVTFTLEQQKAIDLHGRNILVSAAAGSGKTAVLTERIVRMVCNEENPVDIDRLLVVTFTNAAAAEMRERIAAGISKRLSEHPESEHIQRQAALLHNAQITTIDSFCLFLLKNHFNEIGLEPAFRIADEGEIRLMRQEVLEELMEDSHASGDEAFQYCVEYFCLGGREKVLEQHILNLSDCAASFPWPVKWLEERKGDYGAETIEEMCASTYGSWLTEHLRRMLEGCVEKMERAVALCEMPDGPYMYGELMEGELERLRALTACTTLAEYEAKLPGMIFGRLPSKKDDSVSTAKRELAKVLRAGVKESIQSLAESFFATPLELAARQSAACREPVHTLIDLTLDFDRRMREKKQEKKVIDFADMEHYALEILLDTSEGAVKPSPVALEYRQHFAEILIDEYQDSNLVQEYLLKAISGEEEGHFNRFMVGDVKQSIYKFRLARPELFLEKYNTYEEDGDCTRIDLSKNFRSRTEVVQAVNDIFGRLMSKEVGGIPYDSRAALYPGADYPDGSGCASELMLVEKPDKEEGVDAKEAEALAVARRVKELRESVQVMDRESGEMRPVRYSDMVLLLRTTSGWDEVFQEVLEREGIPVYVASKTGYFAAVEVQELLNLLRVLDNPTQDIPLFGTMKAIFGGFSEEEIAWIRGQEKGGSMYDALKKYVEKEETAEEEGETEKRAGEQKAGEQKVGEAERKETEYESQLHIKTAQFLQRIAHYRECTVYLPIRELLTTLVRDFGYLDYVTALPAGSKRRANVEMLFAKASDFEKTSYFGLFHFIRYMEQLEKYDVDYGEAGQLDENADVVRIMSIHKSKGLEFPVTFVSGLGKRFNMQDANQSLIFDMDLGLAVDYVEPEMRIRNKTLRRTALSRKLREDNLAEELRVLYVALTRAREKLILTGTKEKAEEQWERQQEAGGNRLTYLDFMESGSFLDFLLPVMPDTCVQVSVSGSEERTEGELTEQLQLMHRRESLKQAWTPMEVEGRDRLAERLDAIYPYADLAGLYTKTTVSELKIAAMADRDEAAYHTFEEKEIQPYIPLFRRGDEKISGAVRGNAYHRVMELLDFERVLGASVVVSQARETMPPTMEKVSQARGNMSFPEDYETFIHRLQPKLLTENVHAFLQEEAEARRLSEEYLGAVNGKKIEKFLSSRLAYRMWKAQRGGMLYREQPFMLGIDARRLKPDYPEGEQVLIQGIIDAFFVEEGGLVLVDYKTDSVSTMTDLWNRYETQMDYYGEALRKLMDADVTERILYSFHLGMAG